MAATKQKALLHPYPNERRAAAVAAPVMESILGLVSGEALTKNEMLNRIARYPVESREQAAAIPLMRTPITANRLEKESILCSIEASRDLCEIGFSISAKTGNKEEIARWAWVRRAIDLLEANGFDSIHFAALTELSKDGYRYPLLSPDTD